MKIDPRSFKGLSRFLAPSAGGPAADRALAEGLITADQLDECVREQDRTGRPLDEILVGRGFLKAEDVVRLRLPPLPPEVAEASADPLRHVGPYVIVTLLGTGGMAEVWKAWDGSLGRWVALKLLKPEVGHPTQRIEREGRMAGGLSHPNIISIFERGQHQGRPYLVMPYVEGRTPRAPPPPREAARIAVEVAGALDHAHRRGVIHRDVKPGNILVDAGGRPVLTDFGLAIPEDSASSRWALSGTPEYASPEQVRGDLLDARTDVYSLGATLYHFLTGRHPFDGPDANAVAEQVLHAPPPPLRGVPASLAGIVRKAMDRDAGRRYPSVAEMEAELKEFLDRGPRVRSGWLLTVGGALLVSVLSSVMTYLLLERVRSAEAEFEIREALDEGREELARVEGLRRERGAMDAEVRGVSIRAIRAFNRALARSGGVRPEASAGLGRCHELTGQDAWAEESYLRAGDLPSARMGLARIWLRRDLEGRTDGDWRGRAGVILGGLQEPAAEVLRLYAERKWAEALGRGGAPGNEMEALALGISAAELKRWDQALAFLDLGGRAPLVWFHKASVLAGKGDKAAAAAAYGRALEIAPPDWALRAEAVKRIDGLRK